MLRRFTEKSRRVVSLAWEEARELDSAAVGTGHLLLGLLRHAADRDESISVDGLDVEFLRATLREVGYEDGVDGFTRQAKKSFEMAFRQALQLGHAVIEPEHLLLGLLRLEEGTAIDALKSAGVDVGSLRAAAVKGARRQPGARRGWDVVEVVLSSTHLAMVDAHLNRAMHGAAVATAELERKANAMPESGRRVLEVQVAAAGRAQALIANAYQPLVDSMAQRYKGVGVAGNDIVFAGRQGLQRAVERFDWSKGTRFSAYATWWIRQAMTATCKSA